MQILFIDDDSEDYEIFCDALKEIRPESHCTHARSGLIALEMMKKPDALPDYIFLDINMPAMNGKQVLMELKTSSRLKGIPVVIYSTTTDESELMVYKKLGAYEVLSKPYTLDILQRKLKRIIK